MTDFLLVQQLHQMMGELPRPRLMFRKGIGMRGYFKPYRSFREYTCAEIFCEADQSFAVRARFSALLGDGGTADTRRNIKGFAVRFRSGAGEYDVVCSSLPVFFINKSRDFPALAEALRRKTWFDGIQPERFWRFVVNHPGIAALRFAAVFGGRTGGVLSDMFLVFGTYFRVDQREERAFSGAVSVETGGTR